MDAFKFAVMVLLLAACAGDGPPKSGGVTNPPNPQPLSPTAPGSAMTQPPAPQSPPKTTTEQVERWAPSGSSVVDVRARGEADLDLAAGIDVFMVTVRNQPVADGRSHFSVVAIVGGVGNPILEDKAAILAAVAKTTAKTTKDAQKLARVGLLLNGRDDSPLTSASSDEQRKAGVKPPAIANNAIGFWIFSGSPAGNLYHCTLDLSTAALTVGGAPSAASNVVDDAVSALQSGNPAAAQQALDALASACQSNPAAKKLLFATLANHAREDARAAAAFSAPKCGHDALAPLIASLEHDKSRIVRGKVAFALAELGDKSAIPALEKATTTDIATAAGIALDQLKKK
ncbi:MAG: HEAT repeat domain-containing protein [Kofleriaceae bacterium]